LAFNQSTMDLLIALDLESGTSEQGYGDLESGTVDSECWCRSWRAMLEASSIAGQCTGGTAVLSARRWIGGGTTRSRVVFSCEGFTLLEEYRLWVVVAAGREHEEADGVAAVGRIKCRSPGMLTRTPWSVDLEEADLERGSGSGCFDLTTDVDLESRSDSGACALLQENMLLVQWVVVTTVREDRHEEDPGAAALGRFNCRSPGRLTRTPWSVDLEEVGLESGSGCFDLTTDVDLESRSDSGACALLQVNRLADQKVHDGEVTTFLIDVLESTLDLRFDDVILDEIFDHRVVAIIGWGFAREVSPCCWGRPGSRAGGSAAPPRAAASISRSKTSPSWTRSRPWTGGS
jgi:hypothetical protein